MTNNAKPNGFETDIDKAANVFESMLSPDQEQEDNTEEVVAEETVTEETEAVEEEAVEEETLEADADAEEVDEETDELQEDQVEADETEELEVFKVKVDGEELEVTQEELINGYSRNSDYTRKTQELAKLRKELEESKSSIDLAIEEVGREKAEYKEMLPKIKLALQQGFKEEPDWNSLRETDQISYLTEKQNWDEHLAKINKVQEEYDRLNAEDNKKAEAEYQKSLAEGQKLLNEALPEWSDDKVRTEEIAEITSNAERLGFSKDEIGAVSDYRLILLMRDASLYHKQQSAIKKKPTVAKSRRKVAKPGASNNIKPTTSLKKAKQQVAKSGKVSDAANYFEQIL